MRLRVLFGAVEVRGPSPIVQVQAHCQVNPHVFMLSGSGETPEEVPAKHREAAIKQSYKVEDKTILELSTAYDDERADHRVVYQARNR